MQEAFQTYALGGSIPIEKVKRFAGYQFISNGHADDADFLIEICRKSRNVQASIAFKLIEEVGCKSRGILRNSKPESNYVLTLSIPKNMHRPSLQKIIEFNFDQWMNLDMPCDKQCGNKKCRRY